jgi:hypothetical protein
MDRSDSHFGNDVPERSRQNLAVDLVLNLAISSYFWLQIGRYAFIHLR